MMNEKIRKEFLSQEKEDQARMTVCFEKAVRAELDHPERYLQLLKKFKEDVVKRHEKMYGAEARKKYGDEEIDASQQKILNMTV